MSGSDGAGDAIIRALTGDDIASAMELKNLMGWNQTRADWERFLEWEPDGCFCAELDGAFVGTATTTAYQERFGWVGMVLVHPDLRRRRIGRALMERCIEYLEGLGVAAVRLDATPMGRPLYETLGFAYEHGLERWEATARAVGPTDLERLTPELLDTVYGFDRAIFGADRSRVIRGLVGEPDASGWIARADGEISGYAILRPGMNAWYIGPLICADYDGAEQLVRAALAEIAGQPVIMDTFLLGENPVRLALKYGFHRQRELARMYRGQNAYPGIPELVYAPAGPEIG